MSDYINSDSYQHFISENFLKILHLIESKDLDAAKDELQKLHSADLADFLDNIDNKAYNYILPLIEDRLDSQTFACINLNKIQYIIIALGIKKSANIINDLDLEDAIEIIESLNEELKSVVLQELNKEQRDKILEGINYPEHAAGRFLERHFIVFKDRWTVSKARLYLKDSDIEFNEISTAIIVNSKYQPIGILPIQYLITRAESELMSEILLPILQYADCYTDIEHVIFLFKQYSLKIIPIINKSGRVIGVISIDNMIHLVEEYTENRFMQLEGIQDLDIFANIFSSMKHRFPWLFINLISAYLTSIIIVQFTESLSKLIILASIMPIVASMGGNAASQTMTIHIIALSNRELTSLNMLQKITKELMICAINGMLLALIGGTIIYIFLFELHISIIFFLAVLMNFIFAGLIGTGVPIILNHFLIDPAAASGVIVTALTDAFGYFCFLLLAYLFL